MTKKQGQQVRRQQRKELKNDFTKFLRALTAEDLENIFAQAIANRQTASKQEV